MDELVELNIIQCPMCGQEKPASRTSPHMCVDCERALNNRYAAIRNHNDGWMDIAKESDIELFERQPKETQLEWTVWQHYRDSYPGKRANYREVAARAGATYDFVKKAASRWDWSVRMQAWIAECDKLTIAQRRQEVISMNAEHLEMAARLRQKLSQAIDLVDPYELKPSDLNNLLKTATELEKKARLDNVDQEAALRDAYVANTDDSDPNLKKSPTQQGDLAEVVQILLSAGALGSVTQIGVKETTTTTREVVAADSLGNMSSIKQEG